MKFWILTLLLPLALVLGCDDDDNSSSGDDMGVAGMGGEGGTAGEGGGAGEGGAAGEAGMGGAGGEAGMGGAGGEAGEGGEGGGVEMGNLAQVATEAGNFTTLLAAVEAAGLTAAVTGDDPLTVFAPTDDAFAALEAANPGILEALLADPAALTPILTYHVVAGRVDAATVVGLDSATTLNGADIAIEVVDGDVVLNGSVKVTTTDIMASNGIIHVIDAVLLPPAAPMELDLAETAAAAGNFTTLLAAVDAAGLTAALKGEDELTVFAPTDEAFAALEAANPGITEALLADPAALTPILTYHVVAGRVDAATVVGLDMATTLNGADIAIEVVDGNVVLNGTVMVTATDIMASNGIIHVIDAVLLPPEAPMEMNIAEVAAAAGNFTTLLAAVDAAGLNDALTGEDPLTVFAPTDEAFAALEAASPGITESLLADPEALSPILLYHVVAGAVDAAAVVELAAATTLNGADITIAVTEDGVVLNGTVNVIATDIAASNGIIHVIDAVLLPPEG